MGKRKLHQPFSNLFNAYSKAINKKYSRTGSLFQEHLHRVKIDSDEYFKQLILYIHLNPEMHNFTDDFSNYIYSSYKACLTYNSFWIKRSEVVNYFEDKENFVYCHQQRKFKLETIREIDVLDE